MLAFPSKQKSRPFTDFYKIKQHSNQLMYFELFMGTVISNQDIKFNHS